MCLSQDSDRWEQTMGVLVDATAAIAAGADTPAVRLRRAEAHWMVRDHQRTLADLTAAVTGQPALDAAGLAHAYYRRSVCLHQLGRAAEAVADATASLAAMPTPHAYTARAIARYFADDPAGALDDAEEALRRRASEWEARAFRGRARLELGDHAGAVSDFTDVIDGGECTKYASELYLQRAEARLALGDPDAAAADCTAAIDVAGHEGSHWPFIVRGRALRAHRPYLLRAQARLAAGRSVLALADCFLAATVAPEDPAVYLLRAQVFQAVGLLDDALHDLARAAHLQPVGV